MNNDSFNKFLTNKAKHLFIKKEQKTLIIIRESRA